MYNSSFLFSSLFLCVSCPLLWGGVRDRTACRLFFSLKWAVFAFSPEMPKKKFLSKPSFKRTIAKNRCINQIFFVTSRPF